MEEDILDDIEEIKTNKHAQASFWYFISMLVIFISSTLIQLIPLLASFSNILFMILGLCFFILPILGFINGIKSIKAKESSVWRKYIGLIGNLLLCIVLIVSIVVNIFDVINHFQ